MITNSFVLLDHIGKRTEQAIWRSGIKDWNKFIDAAESGKYLQSVSSILTAG